LSLRRRLQRLLDPATLLGDAASVRQDLIGGQHALAYLRGLARGNRIRRKRLYDNVDARHPPVLLLHGFLGTRGSMYVLERRLEEDGFTPISFNLGMFNVRDVRASAFLVHRKVESIVRATRLPKIDIVGHSMGGLIGLFYVKKLGGHRYVRKLVMIGTPVHGTWTALAGVVTMGFLSAGTWQLLPGSHLLRELEDGPLPEGVEFYTVAAERDRITPIRSTHLEGAYPLTVPLGHSSLVISDEVFRRVRWALKRHVPEGGSTGGPTPWNPEV
jgi:triacylglycerol esterase/lipase EstA (alpha/beta hydrolase family)